MRMATQKNIDLCRKIAALAERGERGEKEHAQRKLEQIMRKYNVSTADLTDEALELHEFRYHNEFEKKLLLQVFYNVNHNREVKRVSYGKGSRCCLFFKATKEEGLEARIKYAFYRELWAEEAAFFFECFIQKHSIFRTDPDAPVSQCDDETLLRMGFMIAGMMDKELPAAPPTALGYSEHDKVTAK